MTLWLPPKQLQLSREGPPDLLGRKILAVNQWVPGGEGALHDRFEATLPSERLGLGLWVLPTSSYVDRARTWSLERYTIRDGIQTDHASVFSDRDTAEGFYELPNTLESASTGVYLGICDAKLGSTSAIVAAWEPRVSIERGELQRLYADCHLRAYTLRDADVANEWASWRAPNNPGVTTGTSQDFVHLFGSAIGFSRPLTGSLVPANDILYAIPQVFPRRVRITKIFARQDSAGGAGGVYRIGLYSNSGSTGPMYPSALLHDSGEFVNGNVVRSSSPGITVEANSILWAVFVGSAMVVNALSVAAIPEDNMFPLMGVRYDSGANVFLDSGRISMGWRNAFTYAALPATFPSSAPAFIFNNGGASGAIAPAIWYAFTYV